MKKREIEIVKGDILQSDARFILQQCNNKGVMGAGLAKEIKKDLTEDEFQKYVDLCKSENVLGKIVILKSKNIFKRRYINFIAQDGFGHDKRKVYTKYDCFESALTRFLTILKYTASLTPDINYEVAIPYKIGCGLANGDWNEILRLFNLAYNSLESYPNVIFKIYQLEGVE